MTNQNCRQYVYSPKKPGHIARWEQDRSYAEYKGRSGIAAKAKHPLCRCLRQRFVPAGLGNTLRTNRITAQKPDDQQPFHSFRDPTKISEPPETSAKEPAIQHSDQYVRKNEEGEQGWDHSPQTKLDPFLRTGDGCFGIDDQKEHSKRGNCPRNYLLFTFQARSPQKNLCAAGKNHPCLFIGL